MGQDRKASPLAFITVLSGSLAHRRSDTADLVLGLVLAFVAGAINAGGFLAIGQYTSHMTGVVSSIADDVALGSVERIGMALVGLSAFVAGAGCSAILINWGRRNVQAKQYAYPIALEALLLLGFGSLGAMMQASSWFLALAVPILCFIMGLQNATITKISGARIRTTHLTGMITDIGIELGKALYFHRNEGTAGRPPVEADTRKLSILSGLVGMFLAGGIVGALGFGHLGYAFSIPIAALLILLSAPTLLHDFKAEDAGADGSVTER